MPSIGDVIVLIVILLIISLAIFKMYKDKKNGVKCSGCPHSKVCNTEDKCK